VPNTNLDEWWLNGKVWNPWPEGGTPYWDTGNKGATTLGPSNSTPTDDTSTGTGWAARLETKFVGIGALGKLAAGNLFCRSVFQDRRHKRHPSLRTPLHPEAYQAARLSEVHVVDDQLRIR